MTATRTDRLCRCSHDRDAHWDDDAQWGGFGPCQSCDCDWYGIEYIEGVTHYDDYRRDYPDDLDEFTIYTHRWQDRKGNQWEGTALSATYGAWPEEAMDATPNMKPGLWKMTYMGDPDRD